MGLSKQASLLFLPILESINQTFCGFEKKEASLLPDCSVLNSGFSHKNSNNKALSFIEQNEIMPYLDFGYEQRIFQHGFIATRNNNWHDFFNAMVWRSFAKTKSAINAIHYQESQNQQSTIRSRKRDLLTLFDESGVIVIANNVILEAIKNHDWQRVFVENKAAWLNGEIQIITFGHALYEKYLNPYIGLTAHALFLDKSYDDLDNILGNGILNGQILNYKSELSPLPLLGIPEWHHNQDAAFYANIHYFR